MSHFVGTGLQCLALLAIANRLLGYPRAQITQTGGGVHVPLPTGSGQPGWTERHGVRIQHPINTSNWAYPIDDELRQAIQDARANRLSEAERDELRSRIQAAVTLAVDWFQSV